MPGFEEDVGIKLITDASAGSRHLKWHVNAGDLADRTAHRSPDSKLCVERLDLPSRPPRAALRGKALPRQGSSEERLFRGRDFPGKTMVLPDRIELSTSPLPMECSTTELRQHAPDTRIGPKGPLQSGRSLPQGPRMRKRGRGCETLKNGQTGLGRPRSPFIAPIAGYRVPISSPAAP